MRSFYHLLVLISSGLLLTNVHQLSAQTIQDDRKVQSFENVIISASENTYVRISYDKSHKITVRADGRIIQKVKTTVLGDTLNIHLLDPAELGTAKIEIFIKSPKVKRVIMAGSGQVEIIDGFNPSQLQTLTSFDCSLCS
jgi:hypothetical protein